MILVDHFFRRREMVLEPGENNPFRVGRKNSQFWSDEKNNFNRAGNSTVSRDSQGTGYASPMAALTALRPVLWGNQEGQGPS